MKRVLDIIGALAGLILTAPVLACLCMLIGATMGLPVLFVQRRPGKYGVPFKMYKLRTMVDRRDNMNNLLPDKMRITRLGRFMRTFSLDEIPELLNVVKGEMSLVGPRPLLMKYLERYTPEQARRHEVKPGLTGWAQINGRNALSWEEKLRLDVWYVDHRTILLDLTIILKTILTVLKREGISHQGEVTMSEFKGSVKRNG